MWLCLRDSMFSCFDTIRRVTQTDRHTHDDGIYHASIASHGKTSGSAIAEGPRDVLVSKNSATTKYRYRVALFA